jgi:hypothetical protein
VYKALRNFKVKGADGEYRMVKPGEKVPEAATWKNVAVWIRRRWITDENGNEDDGRHFITGRAPHAHRKIDVGVPRSPAQSVSDKKAAPLPQASPAALPPPEPVTAEPVEPVDNQGDSTSPEVSEMELTKMVKSDLQALASKYGITINGKTKPDLVQAILVAQRD